MFSLYKMIYSYFTQKRYLYIAVYYFKEPYVIPYY